MSEIIKFLASTNGRIVRAILGAGALYGAFYYDNKLLMWILIIISVILLIGSLLDLCLLRMIVKDKNGIKGRSTNNSTTALLAVILILAIAGANYSNTHSKNTNVGTANNSGITSNVNTNTDLTPKTNSAQKESVQKTQDEQLVYLIEEEKLAHDVYTYLYNIYGAKVFGNILKSEQTHQGKVLTLLESRNIADPRSSELGVFKDQNLLNLYNSLTSQGKISATEAYKVGVAIEELDIKDITNQLSTAIDQDVITTLNSLRDGSENHLRAFNRQLGK